ncbi:MAG: AAA family ATPase [Vampirovibrionia bacterium]
MSQLTLPSQEQELLTRFCSNVKSVIYGKDEVVEKILMAMLAGGHVLLEDVPGVGKTLLAKTIASTVEAKFKRIQCTPDLLPSDVSGVSIFNPENREFKFIKGPLFTQVLLVDEINRAAPRTQSCLLEAMEESQVTVEGNTYVLNRPFFVIATQNPIEYHGTFELPEAQLDRFMVVLSLGYPSEVEENNILEYYLNNDSFAVDSVLSIDEYLTLMNYLKTVNVSKEVRQYIVNIVNATRDNTNIRLGVSPRGGLALLKMSQASAMMAGRNYVTPDDVKKVAIEVLSHRVIPVHKRTLLANNSIISEIVGKVKVPE